MSANEVIAFVVFALLGYWIVSFLLQRRSQPWHQVLNIDANASVDEIRAAYQALLSRCDPDEAREIAVAYREAMRSRGVTT